MGAILNKHLHEFGSEKALSGFFFYIHDTTGKMNALSMPRKALRYFLLAISSKKGRLF